MFELVDWLLRIEKKNCLSNKMFVRNFKVFILGKRFAWTFFSLLPISSLKQISSTIYCNNLILCCASCCLCSLLNFFFYSFELIHSLLVRRIHLFGMCDHKLYSVYFCFFSFPTFRVCLLLCGLLKFILFTNFLNFFFFFGLSSIQFMATHPNGCVQKYF